MRRTLLLLALLAPALARGQIIPAGEVRNGTSGGDDPYINIEECSGVGRSGPITLNWTIAMEGGGAPPAGRYRIYASSKAPAAPTGSSLLQCEVQDVPTAVPPVYAAELGQVDVALGQNSGTAEVVTADLAAAATADGFTCDPSIETPLERTIHVCVHFAATGSTTVTGSATGTLVLSLERPSGPPSSLTITPGDHALNLSWPEVADAEGGYRYRLVEIDGAGNPVASPIDGDVVAPTTSVRVSGLQLADYAVGVWSLSIAMNPSEEFVMGVGRPAVVDDFWSYYDGAEQGGCSTGSVGSVALLGLAGLLALLRRRR